MIRPSELAAADKGSPALGNREIEHRFLRGCLRSGERIVLEIEVVPALGFFIAAVWRSLPDFSAFCQAKCLILLRRLDLGKTLDLRIGVRVPASQPLTLKDFH